MANKSFVLDNLMTSLETTHIWLVDPADTIAAVKSACTAPSYAPNSNALFFMWEGTFVDRTAELKNGDYDDYICTNPKFLNKIPDEFFRFKWNYSGQEGNCIAVNGVYNSSASSTKYIFFFSDARQNYITVDGSSHRVIYGIRRTGYSIYPGPIYQGDILQVQTVKDKETGLQYPDVYHWWYVLSAQKSDTYGGAATLCQPIITEPYYKKPITYTIRTARTISQVKNYSNDNKRIAKATVVSNGSTAFIKFIGDAVTNGDYDNITVSNNIFDSSDLDITIPSAAYSQSDYYILETQDISQFILLEWTYSPGQFFHPGDILKIIHADNSIDIRICISSNTFRKIG